MKSLEVIAVGIMIAILVIFFIAINNWDKKKEQGKRIEISESGNTIAKFLFYLFI